MARSSIRVGRSFVCYIVIMMEESQSAEETESPMSKLFINANHDKDTLYLSLECPEGLNIDLIKTVVDNEGGTCTGK